jgi:formylglycine-generating enzyme required for sulfatase activity
MGSLRLPDEAKRPQEKRHSVILRQGFALGIHLVTQAEWEAVMGENASCFKGDSLPVDSVYWFHAVAFRNKLSDKDGRKPYYQINKDNITILGGIGYRLPTEAEWEYACRAGTSTPFHFGNSISTNLANYDGNEAYGNGVKGEYREKTTPVGSFPANAWGLFDMHGNLWEWCWDWYNVYPDKEVTDPQGPSVGKSRVLRGGCWSVIPTLCRSAYRRWSTPGLRLPDWGLRVCCCLD